MKSIPDDRLFASYLSGECTEEELQAIETWLRSNPEHSEALNELIKAWSPDKKRPPVWNKSGLWLKIRDAAGIQQAPIPVIKRFSASRYLQRSSYLIVAAGVLLAVAVTLISFRTIDYLAQRQSRISLAVAKATQQKLTLSDGSVVTLDAGSSFAYLPQFTAREREVYLHGEGYFEVTPDDSRPFIVRVDDALIQVLGTKFSVRSWELDRTVRVAVAEGKVSLRGKRTPRRDAVVIARGQMAAVMADRVLEPPRDVDVDKYLGWLNHDIGFDDTSLQEILFHLERWFDVEFILEDDVLASERLTLHTRQKSIDSVLDMIALLTDLNYEYSDNTIRLFTSE
ncbi:MAG: FecR domain-containing protein [Fidelibacterota bacterium]|nr:MAG: FecR domain-containing protein [Candidatus Neomarinimicrobiota bacterium]